jgi:hypothetical protein
MQRLLRGNHAAWCAGRKNACRDAVGHIGQWMQGHALPDFYHERSHFQSRGDSYRLQGVGKARVAICLFDMGGVGFELLINSLILRPMTKMRSSSTHISNFNVWHFFEDGKKADSVQHQII